MINYNNILTVAGKPPENDRKNLPAEWLISVLDADQKLYEHYSADDIAELPIEEVENRLTQIGVNHERAIRDATKMVKFHTSSDVDKLNQMLSDEEDLNSERADVIENLPADEVSNRLEYLSINTDGVIRNVRDIVDQLPIDSGGEANHFRKPLLPYEPIVLSKPQYPHLRYAAAAAGLLVAGLTGLCLYNSTIGTSKNEVGIVVVDRDLVSSPSIAFMTGMTKVLADDRVSGKILQLSREKSVSGDKPYAEISSMMNKYDLKKVSSELTMLEDSLNKAEIVKCNNIGTHLMLAAHSEPSVRSSCNE